MELDELKYQLKNKLADHAGRSDADIAALLTKKTSSVIGKLKRSLWIEIICSILVIIVFGYIGITSNYQSYRIYFSVFTVLSFGFLLLLIYLFKRIVRLSSTSLPVKNNLQTIVTVIEEFTKRYFQFTMALIPVCFAFILILLYYDKQVVPSAGVHLARKSLFVGVYIILLSVFAYKFTRWYLKKLYANYVAQLKECISDLAE